MARSKNQPQSIFDDEVVEVSRAGLPETGVRTPVRTKLYKSWVWVSVVTLPIALLALIVVANSKTNTAAGTGTQAASTATSSPGRAAATLQVQQWLAGTPSPLPGGQILTWDGAKTLPNPKLPKGSTIADTALYTTEVDSFTLIDGHGSTFTAQVQVALDNKVGAGPQAFAGVSLSANLPASSDTITTDAWPGIAANSDVSAAVTSRVQDWATAYTSGAPDKLRSVTGDPSTRHAYLPLTGISKVTSTVIASASLNGDPSVEIVRVGLTITWAGQKVSLDATTNLDAPQMVMDLLIKQANTGTPLVTAWGAPGTGPLLVDYQNAIGAASADTGSDVSAPTDTSTPGN